MASFIYKSFTWFGQEVSTVLFCPTTRLVLLMVCRAGSFDGWTCPKSSGK